MLVRLAVSPCDCAVRKWILQTGECITTIKASAGPILSMDLNGNEVPLLNHSGLTADTIACTECFVAFFCCVSHCLSSLTLPVMSLCFITHIPSNRSHCFSTLTPPPSLAVYHVACVHQVVVGTAYGRVRMFDTESGVGMKSFVDHPTAVIGTYFGGEFKLVPMTSLADCCPAVC